MHCKEHAEEMSWGAWALTDEAAPYLDVVFFFLSLAFLYLTMDACVVCVFGLLLVSLLFCMRFRHMFLVLWACVIVLWFHNWRFGYKKLSVSWD